MADDERLLRAAYERAVALRKAIASNGLYVPGHLGNDLNGIISSVASIIGDAATEFRLSDSSYTYEAIVLTSKLDQFITYLQQVHFVTKEVDALFNSIKDPTLKRRCADLLSSTGSFDRVINQATQVLEDRIRTKSGDTGQLTGGQLVNAVMKAEFSKTVLKISDDQGEHEGICHICRGIMLAFRNPTHHHITERYTREEALKVLAFIDNLLKMIDNATKI